MRRASRDLHGSVPEKSTVALLLIDVISDFDFPDSDKLLTQARAIVPSLAELKRRAREAGIPSIYVNDNYGRWTSDFRGQLDHCLSENAKGRSIVSALEPLERDYSVLKAKHSGFYGTTLDLVLRYLGAKSLIVTGFTTDICVLFTANDAYMREYRLWIPEDCAAAVEPAHHAAAIDYMKRVLDADVRPSAAMDLGVFQQASDDQLN